MQNPQCEVQNLGGERTVIQLKSAVIGAGFVGRAHIEALRRLGVPIIARTC